MRLKYEPASEPLHISSSRVRFTEIYYWIYGAFRESFALQSSLGPSNDGALRPSSTGTSLNGCALLYVRFAGKREGVCFTER